MDTTDRIELAKQLSKYFHKDQKYGEHDYYTYHISGGCQDFRISC